MLNNIINTEKLYGYKLIDGGLGIAVADTLEAARDKIIKAYQAHGLPDYDFSDLEVWSIAQKPFDNAPDILEIYEY